MKKNGRKCYHVLFYTLIACCMALMSTGCASFPDKPPTVLLAQIELHGQQEGCTLSLIGQGTQGEDTTNFRGLIEVRVSQGDNLLSTLSLNELFNQEALDLTLPAELMLYSYNDDSNPDLPLGFPTEAGMAKYVLLSVNPEGMLMVLPASGYEDENFIYSRYGGLSPRFSTYFGPNQPLGFLVGIGPDFTPASYVWDGTSFVFTATKPIVLMESQVPGNYNLSLRLIQNGLDYYSHRPHSPLSSHYGTFELELVKDGQVLQCLDVNELLEEEAIGFGGYFQIELIDYNGDGYYELPLGQPGQPGRSVMVSINTADAIMTALPAAGYGDEGYIYDCGIGPESYLKLAEQPGFCVTVINAEGNYLNGQYIWQDDMYWFTEIDELR